MKLGHVLLAIVSLLAVQVAAQPMTTGVAESDATGLQIATLPNGFRYALLPHTTDVGRISLRLIVHAGSLDERDDERGYAHFVEHMAFNGTRRYPPGKLVLFFQRNGIHWGADANATTGFTHTTYKLDLPAGHAGQLEEALQIFRDYADGIEFARAEVRREIGVILSELSARNTNSWQVNLRKITAHYQGSAIVDRLPTGTEASIKQATPARLRAFYRRCYRPERMTLLIVGDVAAESVAALVEKHFASLAGAGPGVPAMKPEIPPGDGLRAGVIANAHATAVTVMLTSVRPISTDPRQYRENSHADYVVLRALDRRLGERQRQNRVQIGVAKAQRSSTIDDLFWETGLEVHVVASAWPVAVNLIENELRRARESGFSSGEIKELTDSLRASARALRDAAPRLTPVQLANQVAWHLAGRSEWLPAHRTLEEIEAWAERFDPAAAAQALEAMFSDDRMHLLLTLRETGNTDPAEVLAAYRDSASRPIADVETPPADELEFRYDDFGPAGVIASHRTIADLNLDLVEFANGTRLNVRASETEPNHFTLSAFLGRGMADAPRERPGLQALGFHLLGTNDLNRNTRSELGRLIRTRALSAGVNFAQDRFVLSLQGPSTELPFALRFLAAFLSDQKFDEAQWSQALSAYTATRAGITGSSQRLSATHLDFHLRAGDPRFRLPPPSEVGGYAFAEVVSWVRTHWLDGPIEIALAGDVDVHEAIAGMALTVGALPARNEAVPLREEERSVFPAKLHRNLAVIEMADEAATVQFAWTARDLADARVLRALRFANEALVDRLRVRLREQRGATYSPQGLVARDAIQPDFGFANIAITFDPARAQALAEQVLKLADEFAQKGLTAEEFSRVREVAVSQTAEHMKTNEWWLENVLSRAQSQPTVLDEARTLATDVEGLTRDEVNRVAANHYRLRNAHVAGVIPQRAESATPASPPK